MRTAAAAQQSVVDELGNNVTTIINNGPSTGGHVFGYHDSLYEIINYSVIDAGLETEYGRLQVRNLSKPTTNRTVASISGASKASTCIITTSAAHNIFDGQRIKITSVSGMTQLNGNYYYVVATDTTHLALYSDAALTVPVNSSGYTTWSSGGTVTVADGGLTKSVSAPNGNVTLFSGVRAGAAGDVTVNISTMRATGHDFLAIGTGSYADTNYPNNIYGPPLNSINQEQEVEELNKGRVFFVSTDQSGNFRVGDLFGIDQGTGVVQLGAKISLTNVQALRLKAGAQVVEFSTDVTMGGSGTAANDVVSTQNAVRSYIDKRLGLRHAGGILASGLIGPGFLPLDGTVPMSGPLDVNDNRIRNLPDEGPGADAGFDRDAISKKYMRMSNLQDAPAAWISSVPGVYTSITDGDLLTFTGTAANFTNAKLGGVVKVSRGGTTSEPTLTSTFNDEVIYDLQVNTNAGITQNKLVLNTVRATAADGFTPSGYASNTTVSTTLTITGHPFAIGETISIAGETTVTALNGIWKISAVATNTVTVLANSSAGGSLSAGIRVRSFGTTSGFNSAIFTVSSTGYISLLDSTSLTTGVNLSKLSYINPSVLDELDDNTLTSSYGKVIGRRGNTTGKLYPIDFRTVINDGDGLSRAEVANVGVVARTATGTGTGKFTTYGVGNANTAGDVVRRDSTDGGFSAGTVSVAALTSVGAITGNSLKLTVNSTTQIVVERKTDDATLGIDAYYTSIKDGNGVEAIRINTGTPAARQYTNYLATEHRFFTKAGTAGRVSVGDGGTLTPGNASAVGNFEGLWQLASGARLQATWADLAEWYTADAEYEPGTVVEFGGDAEVRKSSKAGTTKVAGVITTNPAYVMNTDCAGTRACVALQGRVPCKVVGKIEKGDLMVASGIPGVAISAGEVASPGTIIGKALETYDSDRIGTIEIAVGRL